MTIRSLIVIPLVLAGALFMPLSATAAPAATTATPKALSLTLRDVRHVYGGAFRPFMANTYKASHHTACGADYTGGYLETFGNFAKAGRAGGVVSLESTIFAYANERSTVCASKAHGTTLARTLSRPGTTVRVSRLGGVGDSAYLFTTSTTLSSGKKHAYSVMIWFSRGTHIAMVTISALGRAPAQSGAVTLAKVVDGRMQAAG